MMFLWVAHKLPVFDFHARGWFTNTVGLAAYRGPWAIESLAREVLLDRAARQIGIDPLEIRHRNLIKRTDQPCTTCMGLELEENGRAHVCTPVTNAHLVCRLLLEKKKQ